MTKFSLDHQVKNLIKTATHFSNEEGNEEFILALLEVFPRDEREQVAKDCGVVGYSNSYMPDQFCSR